MKKLLQASLLALAMLLPNPKIYAQISIGINISARVAPPALPVYVQPQCPNDGYLWVPGYWAWSNDVQDYYWVPGVWVAAPRPGYLWTPAYWGYSGGIYGFHAGYWGPHVGFYGGINYGGGYGGTGFSGGGWSGGRFQYNTAVTNVNTNIVHNTYIDNTVVVNNTVVNKNASFNGPGGVQAQPRPQELAAMNEKHIQPTGEQQSHEQIARQDKNQFSKANSGKPTNVAMNKVGGTHFNAQGTAKASHHQAPDHAVNDDKSDHQHDGADANRLNEHSDKQNIYRDNPTANHKPEDQANNRPFNQQKPNNKKTNQPSPQHAPQHNEQHHMQKPQQHHAPHPEKEHH